MTAPTGTADCFFMDMLPPEIRLAVYEYLVVSPQPLRGRSARNHNDQYNLELSILRTNRQIYAEARSLFFAKNTFYITSLPEPEPQSEPSDDSDGEPNSLPETLGQFDPPLPSKTWPMIRNLTIDLLYYPRQTPPNSAFPMGWRPTDPGCAAYISTLIQLLPSLSPKLKTFALTASVRDPFCARKCLISFFMCDRDRSFARALSLISPNIATIPFSFEFPDCYYRTNVSKDVFMAKSILLLACQVMFCQSQCRIDELLTHFDGGSVKTIGKDGGRVKKDLGPYVEQGSWGGQGKGVKF